MKNQQTTYSTFHLPFSILPIILISLLPFAIFGKTISPMDYGLKHAKNGEERYQALYQTHVVAKRNHWDVSYRGIRELKIEIPANAQSIPLGNVTDFTGLTLTVTNTKKKNFFLFDLSQDLHPVSVAKTMIDSYDFRRIKELKRGYKILVIEDQNPWVENREGYNYSATRKDVLLLENGKAVNRTIAPYNTDSSNPSCKYAEVTKEQKSISNITFKRTKESTAKTYLVQVKNMNNVLLKGIKIVTPTPVKLTGDNAIGIYNCTNVTVKQVLFDQTYSLSDTFGYGISMNNVWNSWFDEIVSEAAWGIFGNNNINTAHVSNSKINRFDTHCYGKDIFLSNCEITQTGLPQSSFMGELEFKNCSFKSAYVCTARTEYNAFSPFKISLINCVINLDSHHRSLVYLGNVGNMLNKRKELQQKYAPSIYIKNTKVILKEDVPSWALIHVGTKSDEQAFDYIGDITIDGLQVEGSHANLMIYDRLMQCERSVNINLKGLDLIGSEDEFMAIAQKKYVYTPTVSFNINKDRNGHYYLLNSKLNYNPVEFPHYNMHIYNCILGRIRFYNTNNGKASSRRSYEKCVFYLNDIDTDNYTLDDNADYKKCIFNPVNKGKKIVPFSMEKTSEISFEDCSKELISSFGPKLIKNRSNKYKYKFK